MTDTLKAPSNWQQQFIQLKADVEKYRLEADEAKAELEEHVSYSRQIEAEFDAELNDLRRGINARDKEIKELAAERNKLRENLDNIRHESLTTGTTLRKQLEKVSQERDGLAKRVQRLEQHNDDLERQLRITCETLSSTERSLNAEIEANALLTTELEMKEELKIQCRRLEEEIRDLKFDITIKDTILKNTQLSIDKNPSALTARIELKQQQPSPMATAVEIASKNGLKKLSSISSAEKTFCDSMKIARMNNGAAAAGAGAGAGIGDSVALNADNSCCSPQSAAGSISTKANVVLSSPLARNVSPIIADLLRSIQALEVKLHRICPTDRRNACENGIASSLARHC